MLGNGPAWNNARELFPQAIQILDRCRSIDFRRDQRKQAMGRQRVAPNSTTANCILTRKAFALLLAFSRRGCKVAIGTRLKRMGMRWTVQGANAIAIAQRCCRLRGRFEDFWERRHDRTAAFLSRRRSYL